MLGMASDYADANRSYGLFKRPENDFSLHPAPQAVGNPISNRPAHQDQVIGLGQPVARIPKFAKEKPHGTALDVRKDGLITA